MKDTTEDADACIADLGTAIKLRSPHDKVSMFIGSPGYMAPEILLGETYSLPVDIWGLGCILYFLLTSNLPFPNDDWTKLKNSTCYETLDLSKNPELSLESKDLLSSLLSKHPGFRPTIKQVLSHVWLQNLNAPEWIFGFDLLDIMEVSKGVHYNHNTSHDADFSTNL